MNSHILITGGAGFVGTNLAHHYLGKGQRVMIYDNLSRAGVEQNLAWLRQTHGAKLAVEIADVRDSNRLAAAVAGATAVFHFAAQVAVTSSLVNPTEDFAVNAQGTLNLLEALRQHSPQAPLVFTSTNKVYGKLGGLPLAQQGEQYAPSDEQIRQHGIDERAPLDFQSPYGCSKGAADQYVLDYARIYGLPALVFRMSCIYGPHQFGTEDQGWVAHFLIRARQSGPITIYGDGYQVRDILFVDDLVDALARASLQAKQLAGQAFNMGGGPQNAVSLAQVLAQIAALHEEQGGKRLEIRYDSWRPGDQRYYVSNTEKFQRATGWRPQVRVPQGLAALYDWLGAAGREPVRVPVALQLPSSNGATHDNGVHDNGTTRRQAEARLH